LTAQGVRGLVSPARVVAKVVGKIRRRLPGNYVGWNPAKSAIINAL
jgi:hypothetical protein